jgi:hypothetical protein
VALEDIRSIWNRHPSQYVFGQSLTAEEREFCYREATLGVEGVLAALDVLWANHANRRAEAMFKPYQWTVASACGLQRFVPKAFEVRVTVMGREAFPV